MDRSENEFDPIRSERTRSGDRNSKKLKYRDDIFRTGIVTFVTSGRSRDGKTGEQRALSGFVARITQNKIVIVSPSETTRYNTVKYYRRFMKSRSLLVRRMWNWIIFVRQWRSYGSDCARRSATVSCLSFSLSPSLSPFDVCYPFFLLYGSRGRLTYGGFRRIPITPPSRRNSRPINEHARPGRTKADD